MLPPKPYYPSRDPAFYAKRVLKELDLSTPPTPVEPILEYFGLAVQYLSAAEERELTRRAGMQGFIDAFLWANSDSPTIFVMDTGSVERYRMSVFHECGHYDMPWHRGQDYMCNCEGDETRQKAVEREAFDYANCLLFPMEAFASDVCTQPVSITTVEALAAKYEASFAATAIRYVSCHHGLCAILYLERNPAGCDARNPYVVRYSVKSRVFHRYWSPGEEVPGCEAISHCIDTGERLSERVSARCFGSTKQHEYDMDIRRYGASQACVLLTMENQQTSLL
jgi:hypothetical protein